MDLDKKLFPKITFENSPVTCVIRIENIMEELECWIARDGDGLLYLYNEKPNKGNFEKYFYVDKGAIAILPTESFPKVNFENSPKKVKLIIEE